MLPIKMTPIVSGPMPSQGAAKPDEDLELIPEAPKLPRPARLLRKNLLILRIHLRVLHRALLRERILKKIETIIRKRLKKPKSDSSKGKEADRVVVPKFPNPEAYRNWRVRVRDAVTAASGVRKADEAFKWGEEVWSELRALKSCLTQANLQLGCMHGPLHV